MTGYQDEPINAIVPIATSAHAPIFLGPPSAHAISTLNELEADVLLSAAYSFKLPVADLRVGHSLNLHSSLLPQGRGPSPLPHIIENYPSCAGVTLHEMVESFDAGSIVSQEAIRLEQRDGFDELAIKCAAAGVRLVSAFIESYPNIVARPQGEGSYWPLPGLMDRTLDALTATTRDVVQIQRQFGESGIVIHFPSQSSYSSSDVTSVECDHPFATGSIVSHSKDHLLAALSDGLVKLRQPTEVSFD